MKIIPDVLIQKRSTNIGFPAILDTKYKKQDQNDDYYQIISYALAIPSAKNCCLLYPKDFIKEDNLVVSRNLLEQNRDINIYVRGIDLYIEEDIKYKDCIIKIKRQIEDILRSLLN